MICLFHNRRYASNIQHILNLLRKNAIKIKCDLNLIGKKTLCTCKLTSNTSDVQLISKQKEFEKLKVHPWMEEIDQIIQLKISNTCDSQISLDKLYGLICDLSNETTFLKMIEMKPKSKEILENFDDMFFLLVHLLRSKNRSKKIRRHIELSLPSNQIGYLLGRQGNLHKKIMKDTNTRIHFNNVPYSISSSSKRPAEFNLDLFQSSSPLTVTIIGDQIENIEKAATALQKLDQTTQV